MSSNTITLYYSLYIKQTQGSRTLSRGFGDIKGLIILTINVENKTMNQKLEPRTVSQGLANLEGPTILIENKIIPLSTNCGPILDQWSFWFDTNLPIRSK